MARPENRSEARGLEPDAADRDVQLSRSVGDARQTRPHRKRGSATHILVREVYAMIERRFHEMRVPAAEGEGG